MSSETSRTITNPTTDERTDSNKVLKTEVETTLHEVIIEGPDSLLKPKETRIRKNKKLMKQLLVGTALALLVLSIAVGVVIKKTPLAPTKAKVVTYDDLMPKFNSRISAYKTDRILETSFDTQVDKYLLKLREKTREGAVPSPAEKAIAAFVTANLPGRSFESRCISLVSEVRRTNEAGPQTKEEYLDLVQKMEKFKQVHRVSVKQLALDLKSIEHVDADTVASLARLAKMNHYVVMNRMGSWYQTAFNEEPPFDASPSKIDESKIQEISRLVSTLKGDELSRNLFTSFFPSAYPSFSFA